MGRTAAVDWVFGAKGRCRLMYGWFFVPVAIAIAAIFMAIKAMIQNMLKNMRIERERREQKAKK